MEQHRGHSAPGPLAQPRSWNNIDAIARSGIAQIADNDALTGVNLDAWLRGPTSSFR
jgi:hypothetical protein